MRFHHINLERKIINRNPNNITNLSYMRFTLTGQI